MSKAQDLNLRQDVVKELEWDPSIDARTIGVAVEDGIIELRGHVPSYTDKMNAEKIVKRVYGVVGVANDVEVKLPIGGERTDTDIVRSATNALEWHVSVPEDRIKVGVTKGWVTLDGEVDWHFQKQAAEDAVRVLSGVRGVTNKVTLKARQPRTDDVRDQIQAALKRNAELDAKKIDVQTAGGSVTLTGTVRSWVERDDAVNAAWAAPGVTKVVDHIRIHI